MATSWIRVAVFTGLRGARIPTVAASLRSGLGAQRLSVLFPPSCGSMVTQRAFNLSPIAFISTSQKSKVVTTVDKVSGTESQTKPTSSVENLEEKDETLWLLDYSLHLKFARNDSHHENWISYGYSLVDRDEDEWAHHLLMFCTITIMFCWGTFLIGYYPDFKNQAWAQREAYLELERRQSAGLPLIDPNMIPVDQIDLPTDAELADFEIII